MNDAAITESCKFGKCSLLSRRGELHTFNLGEAFLTSDHFRLLEMVG